MLGKRKSLERKMKTKTKYTKEEKLLRNQFGWTLYFHRTSQNFTLRELAKLTRMSQNSLALMEKGKHLPNLLNYHRLVNALGLPFKSLWLP